METFSFYAKKIANIAIEHAPNFILAIVVLALGIWVINNIVKLFDNSMRKTQIGENLRPFLKSILGIGLKVLLIFSVAGIVGVETTSFVAVLAAVGFAIGMALQGDLSNFAAGMMILIFRPFKVNDLIEVQDQWGYVKEIQIFHTIIVTFQNKTVIIPNNILTADIITNLSKEEYIRIDLSVSMPYGEDFEKVQHIILNALKDVPYILNMPKPFVGIDTFDSHSIVLAVWVYTKADNYWDVFYGSNQKIKTALGSNNIKVAYSEGMELGNIGRN